jgi:DNA-binding NarL/FixJ family response regulator
MKITVGIADDHQFLVRSLSLLIESFGTYKVVIEARNGEELINTLEKAPDCPDIIIMDVSMPVMDGVEAARIIADKYPQIKLVALSSKDDDRTIIQMIKAGCCAYLFKEIDFHELEKALKEIAEKGTYNADAININYRRLIKTAQQEEAISLTTQEQVFLQLACSELTYKQVAAKMKLSERTVDGYRESLFGKFNVQSRVGLVLEAIRMQLVKVEQ